MAKGRFEDAETWYGEGIRICEATALKHKVCPQLLSLRSDARSAMGHLAEADDDVRAALAAQSDGKTSAGYGFTLKVLVELRVLQHRYEDAIASADEALAISQSLKGGMIQADLDIRYWRARALFALDISEVGLNCPDMSHFSEANKLIVAQAPTIPYMWDYQSAVISPDVRGVQNVYSQTWDWNFTSLR